MTQARVRAAMTLPKNVFVCASKVDPEFTTSSSSYNKIDSCVVLELLLSSSHFKIMVGLQGRNCSVSVVAMVDCGATALFLSKEFVRRNWVHMHPLTRKIPLYNIDGSRNKAGSLAHYARLRLQVGKEEAWQDFLMTELGSEDVILGLPWLRRVNPKIDWAEGMMEMKPHSGDAGKVSNCLGRRATVEQVAANRMQRRQWWRARVLEDPSESLWCAAGYTYSTKLAEKAKKDQPKQTFEQIVPEEYRRYAKVFLEVKSERLPEHKSYNHAIDLKSETPEMIRSKVYPMPVNEQEELD